jgi:large subunit ribosomal protein L1
MALGGKKYRKAAEEVKQGVTLVSRDALALVKKIAFAKFDETIDAHVNLGIDHAKGEQVVRGSVVLPHGVGKKIRIIVFAKGEHAEAAEKAGADFVGAEDLVEKINGGWLDFDYAIATPDLMGLVGKLAKVLGPRGLLPNKKVGTVTFDVAYIVNDLKKGRLFFKSDKSALVHLSLGKVSFDAQKLDENFKAFVKALNATRPATAKGKFLQKITVASTMGVGVAVDPDEAVRSLITE